MGKYTHIDQYNADEYETHLRQRKTASLARYLAKERAILALAGWCTAAATNSLPVVPTTKLARALPLPCKPLAMLYPDLRRQTLTPVECAKIAFLAMRYAEDQQARRETPKPCEFAGYGDFLSLIGKDPNVKPFNARETKIRHVDQPFSNRLAHNTPDSWREDRFIHTEDRTANG